MSCKWETQKLGDLCDEITVGFVGSMTKEYVDDGIPFFRSKNISEYEVNWNDIKYVSSEFHSKLKKSSLSSGDVAIVRTGKPGTCCVIPENIKEANCSDIVIVRVDSAKLCPHYLSFFMNTMANHQVSSRLVGAVQQHFNVGAAKQIEIPLPSLQEQKDIVHVLKTISDKILFNTQTNQTLEEMAQAIFKSWFVDFDPVKAKVRGEEPEGMDAATAALFPDKLVESELGLIPKGWEVKPFADWVKITKGKNITKKTIVEGDVPVVAGGLKPAYFHNTHNVEGPAITISASGANAGFVNLYFQNIWASDCSYISESTTPFFYLQYVFLVFNQKKIFGMQTGAAQPHIYPRDFERLMVVIPNEELWLKLENIFASFFREVANNKAQNIELSQLRDTLLPKLLSGEIILVEQEDTVE
jgi:type I restriction enzyme S subunit